MNEEEAYEEAMRKLVEQGVILPAANNGASGAVVPGHNSRARTPLSSPQPVSPQQRRIEPRTPVRRVPVPQPQEGGHVISLEKHSMEDVKKAVDGVVPKAKELATKMDGWFQSEEGKNADITCGHRDYDSFKMAYAMLKSLVLALPKLCETHPNQSEAKKAIDGVKAAVKKIDDVQTENPDDTGMRNKYNEIKQFCASFPPILSYDTLYSNLSAEPVAPSKPAPRVGRR